MIQKLKKNVCKISVSGLKKLQQGTGFLISNKLIMTAYHVLEDANEKLGEIEVHFNDDIYSVSLHKLINEEYKNLDVAILELEEEVDFYQNIDFLDKKLNSNEKWITRGYPSAKRDTGEELTHRDCVIHQHLDELSSGNYDIELNLHGKFDSYSGLSGSPIIVDEKIVGFLTKELSDSRVKEFRGLSFKYFKDLIDEVNRKEQNKNEITETIKNSLGIELVKVELKNRTLYIGKYPVTFEEYDLFYDEKKDVLKLKKPKNTHFLNDRRGKYPVVNVNWYDAKQYCNWVGEKIGIKCGLPPVEEWNIIVEKNKISDENIWHSKNIKKLQPIGLTESGELGICDMYGNIQEWCYEQVLKGGTFLYTLKEIKENVSKPFLPNDTTELIGFRIFFEKH